MFMLTNVHLHFDKKYSSSDFDGTAVCFSAGSAEEWSDAASFVSGLKNTSGDGSASDSLALVSAGLHPWSLESYSTAAAAKKKLLWLEELLVDNADEVAAVGECGIDLYSPELKAALPAQIFAFEKQMELAERYKKPLVVHCRRSIQYFFEYAPRLIKLPSVIFHAFPGTLSECESLLKRGLNAYFSFGGSFLRGGKKAAECVDGLPDDRLLLETDADECAPALLQKVYDAAADIRGTTVEKLCAVCENNFRRAFLC